MQIERAKAVALFVALGLKNADKWNAARMGTKLSRIKDMVDEDVALEEVEKDILAEVMLAIEAGEEIEVLVPEAPEPEAAAEGDAAEADPGTERPKKAKKAKKEPKEKKAKEPKEPRAKKRRFFFMGRACKRHGLDKLTAEIEQETNDGAGAPGSEVTTKCHWARVRPGLSGYLGLACREGVTNRAYLAGKILKGNPGEITPAMVTQLDTESGRPNPKESATMLRAVSEAIEGYNSVEVDETAETAA